MGAFGGLIQTNKGRNLQAKAEAGAQLKFTRMGVGDGQLGGQSIPSLNKLIHETMSLPITRLKPQLPAQAIVGAVLSNQDVTTGFFFRELGIFAQDPDEGEILYAYGNSGSGAEYIPPKGTADIIEKTIDMIVTFGQAQNVSAVINSSLIFATPEDVETALEEAKQYTDTAVAGVKVPDASLTQKGIVQLSNATNGTRENVAATEKAVKDAYDRGSAGVNAAAKAIPKAIPDTRSVATKPSDYSSNVAYSFKTGSVVGLPAEQFVVIHGFKGWNDDSGGVTHEYASGGTSGKSYHRTGTSSNDSWGPWRLVIDESYLVRGSLPSGTNLDTVTTVGNYQLHAASSYTNIPSNMDWSILEVAVSGSYVTQTLTSVTSQLKMFRTRTENTSGWSTWRKILQQSDYDALFQSVANGKQAIATAISGKGIAASGSDEFAVLANKISQIQTSSYRRAYYNAASGSLNTGRDVRRRIPLADLGVVKDMLITDNFTLTANISGQNYTSSYVESVVEIHNTAGQIITVYTNRVGSTEGPTYLDAYTTLLNIALNLRNRTGFCVRQFDYTSTRAYNFTVPDNFDTSLPLSLVASFFFYVGYGDPNATYSASINGNIAFA